MFTSKKCFYLTIMLCFLTISLSFPYLWAQEPLKKTSSDQKKSESEQKNIPGLSIKGVKIETVSDKETSVQQKSESKQKTTSTNNQPQISLDTTHYDAGEVWEGDEVSHVFAVKNLGTAQLDIKNVSAGWGCAIVHFDRTIPPGQEGKITMKVKVGQRAKRFTESAIVYSNDPQKSKTRISLSGVVKHYIKVEPSTTITLQGYYGDKIKKTATITPIEQEQPLKITEITSNIDDKIKYTLETIKKGEKYSLEITTLSGIKEPFRGNIVLKTNSQKKPQFKIYVTGKLQKEIKVSPEYVYFGIIDISKEVIDPKSLKRTVMVSKAKGDDFVIEKIETNANWIITKSGTQEKGKKYNITITIDKDKLPKGKFRKQVTIHTKCKKRAEKNFIIIEGKAT